MFCVNKKALPRDNRRPIRLPLVLHAQNDTVLIRRHAALGGSHQEPSVLLRRGTDGSRGVLASVRQPAVGRRGRRARERRELDAERAQEAQEQAEEAANQGAAGEGEAAADRGQEEGVEQAARQRGRRRGRGHQ